MIRNINQQKLGYIKKIEKLKTYDKEIKQFS